MRVPRARTRMEFRQNPDAKAVAEKLGVDLSTVYRHTEGMDRDLLREMHGWDLKDIARVLLAEMEPKQVARKLGVSPQYISQVNSNEEVAA